MSKKIKYVQLLSFLFLNMAEVWAMEDQDAGPPPQKQTSRSKKARAQQNRPAAKVENPSQSSPIDSDDKDEIYPFQKKKDCYDQRRLERYTDLAQSEANSPLSSFYQEEIVKISDEQEDRLFAQSIDLRSRSNYHLASEKRTDKDFRRSSNDPLQDASDDEWHSEDEDLEGRTKADVSYLKTPLKEKTDKDFRRSSNDPLQDASDDEWHSEDEDLEGRTKADVSYLKTPLKKKTDKDFHRSSNDPLQDTSDDEWHSEDEDLEDRPKANVSALKTPFKEENLVKESKIYIPSLKTALKLLGNGSAEAQFELKSEKDDAPSILYTPDKLKAKVIDFEPEGDLPDFSTLDPNIPFSANFDFGKFHKRIRYSFKYEYHEYTGETLDTLSPAYIPEPKWELIDADFEDEEVHKSRLYLHLKVKLEDNSSHNAFTYKTFLKHEDPPISQMGPQLPGKLYFNGKTVTLRQCRPAKYTIPACLGKPAKPYNGLFNENEQVVPTHANSKIVFVEILPIPGEALPDSAVGYRGDYDNPSRSLPFAQQKGNLTAKYLIYSDGTDIFLPKVTHEWWERNGWRVGFGIASYQESQKIEFIPLIKNKLPEGLYRLDSIKDKSNQRIETWIKLGEDSRKIRLTPPAGVSSVIGMGCVYVPPLR